MESEWKIQFNSFHNRRRASTLAVHLAAVYVLHDSNVKHVYNKMSLGYYSFDVMCIVCVFDVVEMIYEIRTSTWGIPVTSVSNTIGEFCYKIITIKDQAHSMTEKDRYQSEKERSAAKHLCNSRRLCAFQQLRLNFQ